MMDFWTNTDIEAILIQLNNQRLPFEKYKFSALGEGMTLLGRGASANVYEALSRERGKHIYAIKVIGFSNKHVDSQSFRDSVEAQRKLGTYESNIVRILDSVELRVWIEGQNEVVKAERIGASEDIKPKGNYLHLQFVLMEQLLPIFVSHRQGQRLVPHGLEIYDENEIMKLARDIGNAICYAHKQGLIHRDIKPENVFYDTKWKNYKLGDFGIAKLTDDGMASTIAFTKGYGAPEVVGTLDDKYDYTADIYSFGMMLYVLLNEMRFPESAAYRPTVYQYVHGYVPPEPLNGSDELVRIVLKMIRFDPDERYQTMEEVLHELDGLKFGRRMKYQREHKNTSLVLGSVTALAGSAMWKLSFMPQLKWEIPIWLYLLCGLCLVISIWALPRKKKRYLFYNYLFGILSGCVLMSDVVYRIMNKYSLSVNDFVQYRWLAVLFLSLTFVLLSSHGILRERDEDIIKAYFGKNIFWILATAYYVTLVLVYWNVTTIQDSKFNILGLVFGEQNLQWMMSWEPHLVGVCGTVFCIAWMLRERFLIMLENRREKTEL